MAPSAVYVHGPGSDDVLMRLTGATATTAANAAYYHADGLGSIAAVSNSAGAPLGVQRFDAWGQRLDDSSTGTIAQYGYTGREPDETGLVYYRARYYQPGYGRFTARDPLGLKAGINPYAYVNANPATLNDPSGKLASLANLSSSSYYGITSGLSASSQASSLYSNALYAANQSAAWMSAAGGVGSAEGVANSATGAALREDLARQAGIPRGLDNVWGSNLSDLKASYAMDGWTVADKAPRASSSGNAQVFVVNSPNDGSPVVTQVQYSPASDVSVHSGQYYKFSYSDRLTVKVIDPNTYRVTGWPENNTKFYNQSGDGIVYDPISKVWGLE